MLGIVGKKSAEEEMQDGIDTGREKHDGTDIQKEKVWKSETYSRTGAGENRPYMTV